jgi:hypothetical protein
MLCEENSVCYENIMKRINVLHDQNTESLNITACGTYSSTGLKKIKR